MTGYRADSASLAEADNDGWKLWQTILEQVFPRGTRWPWLPLEDQPSEAERYDSLRVAGQEFNREILAARTARHFTATVLRGWSMSEVADDAALAVCELVTNAVRHGLSRPIVPPCPVRLLLFGSHRALLCVVTDPSDEPPLLREPDYVAETGRGLQVVAGVSEMWGWSPIRPRGKAVWAGFTSGKARMESITPRDLT
ncbi:ATP-binding protein [Sphaerimonospora cavernae]|uniref:ATP-binding protein n=1 Tax=Sphaerimonospora cavernae TaxID=1740611 RepID=A0ABV6U7A2_9ACTN